MGFPIELLKQKGAKRACLEYIAQEDPDMPIPEEIDEKDVGIGDILRSDHWLEFDDFYGMFYSLVLGERRYTGWKDGGPIDFLVDSPQTAIDVIKFRKTGDEDLDREIKFKRELFDAYCKAKGFDAEQILKELKIYSQKFVESRLKGTVFVHPNNKERYFIHLVGDGLPRTYIVEEKKGELEITAGEHPSEGRLS